MAIINSAALLRPPPLPFFLFVDTQSTGGEEKLRDALIRWLSDVGDHEEEGKYGKL